MTTLLLCCLGALLIGVTLGLLGGGGSILTVPLMVYLLGYSPIVAGGYSLFVVGFSSLFGTVHKYRQGSVNIRIGLLLGVPSFLVVYITRRYLVPHIPDILFGFGNFTLTKGMGIMLLFSLVMLFVALTIFRGGKIIDFSERGRPKYIKTMFQGVLIGIITGILGIGGGFLYVPILILGTRLSAKMAIGTSLFIITLKSLIGFFGDIQILDIDWIFLLTFSAVSVIGIFIGSRFAKRLDNKNLVRIYGYILTFIGVSILAHILYQLV
ncbi:sulfite exporter TauE/SafE family protein [Flagellimonas allohymeniacidonis]|uniref:Probable membrane transporter protein n=2 Tax=Flagellimonas allohymeniacidonis TaxID=2517819 RepID=A0A4Q8QMK4_9FLAO|nr:sulfite exporter TauE/SafE family protein [Allomuricauda hymeniacidonis]